MTITRARVVAEDQPSTDTSELSRTPTGRPHAATDAELRRAYATAQQLVERLEVADLRFLHRVAVAVREEVFLELLALNERQVGDTT